MRPPLTGLLGSGWRVSPNLWGLLPGWGLSSARFPRSTPFYPYPLPLSFPFPLHPPPSPSPSPSPSPPCAPGAAAGGDVLRAGEPCVRHALGAAGQARAHPGRPLQRVPGAPLYRHTAVLPHRCTATLYCRRGHAPAPAPPIWHRPATPTSAVLSWDPSHPHVPVNCPQNPQGSPRCPRKSSRKFNKGQKRPARPAQPCPLPCGACAAAACAHITSHRTGGEGKG